MCQKRLKELTVLISSLRFLMESENLNFILITTDPRLNNIIYGCWFSQKFTSLMFFNCKKASFQQKIKLFSLIKRNFLLQPIISSSFQPGIRPLPPLPTYKLQIQKQKQETEIKPSLPVNLNLHCHRCTVIFKIFWGKI